MRPLRFVPAVLLLVLAAASPTSAEPTAPSAAPSAHSAEPHRRVLEELRRRGLPVPSASVPLPLASAPPLSPSAGASAAAAFDQAVVLAQRWRKLAETRQERRAQRHAQLAEQLGPRLADPRVREELRVHATRVAELARLRFLAENARSGSTRQQLLERIDRLSQREAERHRQALARLRSSPVPAASASGAAR